MERARKIVGVSSEAVRDAAEGKMVIVITAKYEILDQAFEQSQDIEWEVGEAAREITDDLDITLRSALLREVSRSHQER